MSNKWNNIIREKLESHEVPADHLWNNISQNIPQPSSSSFWKPWMTTAAIGTVAVATSAIIYFNSPNQVLPVVQTSEPKVEVLQSDSTSNANQAIKPIETRTIQEVVTAGDPEPIYSGYIWQLPEGYNDSLSQNLSATNNEIVAIVVDSNAPLTNVGTREAVQDEPLTNSFTAVISNPESLRYFFFGAAENADSYVWNFGDGFDGQGQSIAHEFTEEGTYVVQYVVMRGDEKLVQEKTIEVYRPAKLSPVTAFAPGFDGKNDVFDVLYNARNVSEAVDFKITDVNGRLVYQSGGQSVWDGKNLNGELCQPAYYYWLLEYKDKQGNMKSQSGSIRIFAE
jgi:PKD repeat protein